MTYSEVKQKICDAYGVSQHMERAFAMQYEVFPGDQTYVKLYNDRQVGFFERKSFDAASAQRLSISPDLYWLYLEQRGVMSLFRRSILTPHSLDGFCLYLACFRDSTQEAKFVTLLCPELTTPVQTATDLLSIPLWKLRVVDSLGIWSWV